MLRLFHRPKTVWPNASYPETCCGIRKIALLRHRTDQSNTNKRAARELLAMLDQSPNLIELFILIISPEITGHFHHQRYYLSDGALLFRIKTNYPGGRAYYMN